jgi:hypothetical protein
MSPVDRIEWDAVRLGAGSFTLETDLSFKSISSEREFIKGSLKICQRALRLVEYS